MSPKSKNKKKKYRPFDPEALERREQQFFWREYQNKTTEAGLSFAQVAGSQQESTDCKKILQKLWIQERKRRLMAEARVAGEVPAISQVREEYPSFDSRLVTFCGWPPSMTQKPTDLAEAGFYYTGRGDEAKCFSCGVTLNFWLKDEVPWARHAVSFPSCEHLLNVMGTEFVDEALSEKAIKKIKGNLAPRKSSMLIAEEVDKILKSDIATTAIIIGLEEEAVRDVIKSKLKEGENPFQSAESLVDLVLAEQYSKLECDTREIPTPLFEPNEVKITQRPAYNLDIGNEISPFSPEFSDYLVRLSTFSCWPPSIPKRAQDLAEAGFYYTEKGDKVKCFCCDARLSCWLEDSDPWLEHAIARPTCEVVLLIKGQQFVNEALILKATEELNMDESSIKEVVKMREESGEGPFLSAESLCAAVLEHQSGEKEDKLNDSLSEILMRAKDIEISTLEEENQRLKEACQCKICMLEDVGSVFLPCGHIAACMNCATKCTTCPICRKPITNKIKSFLS